MHKKVLFGIPFETDEMAGVIDFKIGSMYRIMGCDGVSYIVRKEEIVRNMSDDEYLLFALEI
jgi:hypothetical protein